jgi:colicin import membrane protein
MTGNRFLRQPGMLSPEPKLGRMLGASLALHLVVVLVFTGVLLPRMKPDLRPVYVVDLVNLPVANPQAGRPDATPKQPKAKPIPPPEPAPAPKPVVKAQPQPPVKPAPKPQPKPIAKPVVKAQPKADYQDTVSAIEKLKRQKEIEQLKQSLAGLQAQDTRQAAVKAPLGETTGTGTEAGVSAQTWLQEYYKQAWSLSKYQVSRLDLEAAVLVIFDARGYLKDYRIVRESGDRRFDDSVTQAIRSLERLPREPGQKVEYTIHFNLKDLIDR